MARQYGRAVLAVGAAVAVLLAGCSGTGSQALTPDGAVAPSGKGGTTATPSPIASATASAPSELQLPRGGRTVFPRYRLVGYAGVTGATTLGRLGIGDVHKRVEELERKATAYAAGRQILPVMEIIVTVADGYAGKDGLYRHRMSSADIQGYLDVARQYHALLLLNIQPGRSSFMDEVKAYAQFLKEPDVGVALDPEWAMAPGQVPGRLYGHTTGATLNDVAEYLSGIVETYSLPQKVMVYHQVATVVVRHESGLKTHHGVVVIKSVDGIGNQAEKLTTYRAVNKTTPAFVHAGFKLFFEEDSAVGPLMTPQQVLAIHPQPEYVMYE